MTETGIDPAAELSGRLESLNAEQTVKLVRELCAQLQGEQVVFHGDIWPGNVRISKDGRAILGAGSDAPVSERRAEQVEYVAPEFFWDGSGTGASDVYSLGMMLYAGCNGGYLPFQPRGGALTEKDRSGALRKRMKGEELRIPTAISDGLQAVLRRALAYEPEDRYATAGALLTALGETDEALPSGPAPDAPQSNALDEFFGGGDVLGEKPVDEPAPSDAAQESADVKKDEVSAVLDEDLAWLQEDETPAEDSGKEKEHPYSVHKDFERPQHRSASAAPATRRRKKKTSPLIPVLCVVAVAVIAGAVWLGVQQMRGAKNPGAVSASEPFVPDETPEAAATPKAKPTTAPTPTPEPVPEDDEDEEEASAPTGSAVIDGMDVEPASDTVYVIGSGTNLRSGPSTTYDIAETLTRGTELARTGTVNGWSQVQYEGVEYYVSTSLVSETDPLGREKTDTESLDEGDADAEEETVSGVTVKPVSDTVTVNALANLRSGPGTDQSIVTTAEAGTTLTRTGVTGVWSRVEYGGKTVYVHNNMITEGASATAAPASTAKPAAPSTPTPAATPVSTAHIVQAPVTTKAPATPSPVPVATPSVMDTLAQNGTTSDAVGTAKVVSDVNVRSGPSTDDSILGIVKAGNSLTVTGVEDGKWYRVSYDGQTGYVNRMLVSLQDSFTLTTEQTGTLTITTLSNIRSGPGTQYTILATLDEGTELQATGKTDNGWYRVNYNDTTGYISESLVK